MFLTITKVGRTLNQPPNLWEISGFEVMASDRMEHGSALRVKGQETSLWSLDMDSKHYYHIVPNTARREIESDFILRVFSTKPIVLESVNPIPQYVMRGDWRRVGDLDSTGGPLKILHASDGTYRDNPKWCQNPQFHVEIADPFGKEEMYLKVVVRRIDNRKDAQNSKGGHRASNAHEHHHHHGSSNAAGGSSNDTKRSDANVGLVICKAQLLDESHKGGKKKPPRQNILGELLPNKMSSLKKHKNQNVEEMMRHMELNQPKTILRTLSIDPNEFHLVSTFCSKTDACIFFPKIPRAWIPNGLLLIPCLSEKNAKASFDIEVYASERIYMNPLPETYSRTIAGDWADNSSGGNHLNPQTWKKNPKFTLKLHFPVNSEEPAHVRITLARVGTNWRNMSRRDTVGCMIGFYIFVNHANELRPYYDSNFVPDNEISTEPTFTLPQLGHGESYTIMPTTFADGKLGPFVLSILSEFEFTITRDK
mmetsp:Transcript_2083/g.3669  ORF Transcript_2083/g.3669 Transcript_2083/m.3669 type:complete len:480 (-) Transcript_2083:295-1734(-)